MKKIFYKAMKNIFLSSMLILFLSISVCVPVSAQIQTITISGAGADVNGEYYQSSSFSERINFTRNDDQRLIFYASGIWRITNGGGWVYYSNSADTPLPPESGWIIYSGEAAAGGTDPVPAVDNMVIYVNPSASGLMDGSSWSNAYTDLHSALSAATSGHRIAVKAGTYIPSAESDRNKYFELKPDVAVYGGFYGGETFLSERDPSANVTILSGDIGTPNDSTDNSYHVVANVDLLTTGTVLDGFTVTKGNALDFGGGIFVTGNPTISNCVIISNNSVNSGGGIYFSGTAYLDNCIVSGNTSQSGGGLYANGAGTVINCTFTSNEASNSGGGGGILNTGGTSVANCTFNTNTAGYGGGMFSNSTVQVTGCTFYGNRAMSYGGGGIYAGWSTGSVDRCTFHNNIAWNINGTGGGIGLYQANYTVTNSKFTGNGAGNIGGGLDAAAGSNLAIKNCLIASNTGILGGGISAVCYGGTTTTATITNCTIVQNSYGGLFSDCSSGGNAAVTVNNSILWGNTQPGAGAQIYQTAGEMVLNHSCYADGPVNILYYGTLTATNDNITEDPSFSGSGDDAFAILGLSPCADAGDNSYNVLTTDIRGAGFGRTLSKTDGTAGTIDIGAYEYKFSVDALPVEFISFTAAPNGRGIELAWKTSSEVNNHGFEIERKPVSGFTIQDPREHHSNQEPETSNNQWTRLGFVEGNGYTNTPHEYSYVDRSISAGTYSYRLKQIDRDGKFTYSQEVEASISTQPAVFALEQNYPNPFNPSTTIGYQIPMKGFVTLKVFDMVGREVTTLVNEVRDAGSYTLRFDGSSFSSGVYFYVLRTGSLSASMKFSLIK